MVEIKEWIKGISFTIFGAILFYMFWDNIFGNILSFVGNNTIIDSGVYTSYPADLQILSAIAWVTFVLLFIFTVPVYFFYSIIVGTGRGSETHPLELLKAIGVWCVLMPFLVFIDALIHTLIGALPVISGEVSNLATGESATWTNAKILGDVSTFGWFITFVAIAGLLCVPMYYILKGYGIIGDEGGNR